MLQGPGENAGAVDIGDGLAAVFKIESHNHPSFIEPYQGAATGVGGILRDIFTMGARPIALMNSLRFGPPDDPRQRRLLAGVVAGIGGYGNAFGCPTVGGEVVFDECYAGNPLVNAFCLGIARADAIFLGRAEGVGNTVFYVGAKTGRDGIHGATMASAEFGEGSEEKRPTVQVGDPFMEKVLLEACLEAMKTGAIVGIQDMGAAGLTCSTAEMGARAGTGIEIDVAQVPKRETGMTAYEVMLSESQERMLLVAEKGREREVIRRLREVGPARRGHRHRHRGRPRCASSTRAGWRRTCRTTALTDEAPVYERPWVEPREPGRGRRRAGPAPPADLGRGAAARCWPRPTSRASAGSTASTTAPCAPTPWSGPGSDAAVVRVKGTQRALAIVARRQRPLLLARSLRGRAPGRGRGLPQRGGRRGRAHRRHQLPQLRQPREARGDGPARARASQGIGEACRALDVPITGGNVSLYNETDGRAIYPDAGDRRGRPAGGRARALRRSFRDEGDARLPARRDRRRPGRQRAG